MPIFKQSEVDYLVRAKKFIHRTVEDNNDWQHKSPHDPPNELRITYEIRRKDSPGQNIRLQFNARREMVPGGKWGVSLRWHNERIRCIDYKLREDVIRGGLIVGSLRHWHEHQWTDEDGDKNKIDVNAIVKNEDMRSIIEMSLDRWNIEGYGHQFRLEGLK